MNIKLDPKKCNFYFKELDGRFIFVNEAGDWCFFDRSEFSQIENFSVSQALFEKLRENNLYLADQAVQGRVLSRLVRKNDILNFGPLLHIVVPTWRCNQKCAYCSAADNNRPDMDEKTAQKVLDRIFEAKSDFLTLEFQGGEPLINFEILQYIIIEARKREKASGKKLGIDLCTNLLLLDEEKARFLLKEGVNFSISFDGPEFLHNQNRPLANGQGSYALLKEKISLLRSIESEKKFESALKGLTLTVSKESLGYPREIISELSALGLPAFYIRPLTPLGRAEEDYSAEEYADFYKKYLDYLIEKNRRDRQCADLFTVLFLKKIYNDRYQSNHCDLRSPCGAATLELAYDSDGRVYTCDEARMLPAGERENFCVGDVFNSSLSDYMQSGPARACAVASCLESNPQCADCAYKAFCGTCPVHNYLSHRDIFPRPGNFRCELYQAVLGHIFSLIGKDDPFINNLFLKWSKI